MKISAAILLLLLIQEVQLIISTGESSVNWLRDACTDPPDINSAVDHGRKALNQTKQFYNHLNLVATIVVVVRSLRGVVVKPPA